jgi:hypothetical protein
MLCVMLRQSLARTVAVGASPPGRHTSTQRGPGHPVGLHESSVSVTERTHPKTRSVVAPDELLHASHGNSFSYSRTPPPTTVLDVKPYAHAHAHSARPFNPVVMTTACPLRRTVVHVTGACVALASGSWARRAIHANPCMAGRSRTHQRVFGRLALLSTCVIHAKPCMAIGQIKEAQPTCPA